jgi:DNA-binding response OmpR family regulator
MSSREFRFENVRLLLADTNGQVRYGLKGALFNEGFRDILDTSSYVAVREAVEKNAVDVVLLDVDLPGGDVCELISQVRHHKVGNNPFIVSMLMTADPTQDLVRRMVDSGADDLVVKPFSPVGLITRLKTLTRGRKPFVVTHDYIGPDRRKSARENCEQIPLMEVPNPLRSKAIANADTSSLQRLIDAAASRINQQKMERYSVQIGYLAEHIAPFFVDGRPKARGGPQFDEVVAHLEKLRYIGEDLGYRMRGTVYAHVSELALSLIGVAERIRASIEPGQHATQGNPGMGFVDHRDVELLPKIAQALDRAFNSDQGTAEAAHKISEQVRDHMGQVVQDPTATATSSPYAANRPRVALG